MGERAAGAYKPRNPKASPLYACVEDCFEEFERVYDGRFQAEYGFWRPVIRKVADKFLDCGDLRHGFARIKCENPKCRHELLLAFSRRGRYFCPSCHAKRVVAFALWLEEEVLAAVPHRQYVFTIPKLLRVHFRFDRKLLGLLSSCAYESILELYQVVSPDPAAVPGVVASIQTYGDKGANWNPHAHLIVADGVFSPDGCFTTIPPPDPRQLMPLFRHKLLKRLLSLEKITERTVEILDSFRHPGFSVYQGWPIAPRDRQAREKLAAYVLHAPIALDRMNYDEAQGTVSYQPKPPTPDSPPAPAGGPKADGGPARFDPLGWLAAATSHISNKGRQLVRYSGWYSNKSRGCRKKAGLVKAALAAAALDGGTPGASSPPVELPGGAAAAAVNDGADDDTPFRKQCLRAWARLIQRVYEIGPLRCPKRKSPMGFAAFIEEGSVIRKTLNHLGLWDAQKRAPPAAGPALCGSEKVAGQPGLPLLPCVAEPAAIYDEPRVSYDEPA